MITIEVLCARVAGLQAGEVEQWIGNAWLRAEGPPGHYRFEEIDVARVRLIQELRNDLGIEDESLPVVLSLIDCCVSIENWLASAIAAAPAPEVGM